MAKTQPKVSELVEILLQQVDSLQTSVDQNNKIQLYLSNKIENTEIKIDVTELTQLKDNFRNNLKTDFSNYANQLEHNNEVFLKTSKHFSSKKIAYLIGLNVLLLLLTGISMYIATKNVVSKSDYELLNEENKVMKSQIENIKYFFEDNPKTAQWYKKWNKNISK